MIPYTIRPCQPRDLGDLLVLFKKHADHEMASFDPVNKENLLEQALFSNSPALYCWIVEMDGTCVGYCSYTFDFSSWDAQNFLHLDCLYLESNCRGLGIGKEIFKRLTIEARKKNCVNIQWQTPTFNTKAIKFYHAIGATAKQKERFTYSL